MSRIIFIIFSIFSFSTPSVAGPGIVIGNSGDGYLNSDGRVLLRDLVEVGLTENAFIGYASDPFIKRHVIQQRIGLGSYNQDALIFKLSGIQKYAPALGDLLLKAIGMHQWRFISSPLSPLPHDERLIEVPSDYKPVQIANRLNRSIYVHKAMWDRMPEKHQIALVVHEAVSSLLKPQCSEEGGCFQSARRARELVGLLFSPYPERQSELIRSMALEYLDMDEDLLGNIQREDLWEVELIDLDEREVLDRHLLSVQYETSHLSTVRRKVCLKVQRLIKHDPWSKFEVQIYRSEGNAKLDFEEYPALFDGKKTVLFGLRAEYTKVPRHLVHLYRPNGNVLECLKGLREMEEFQ